MRWLQVKKCIVQVASYSPAARRKSATSCGRSALCPLFAGQNVQRSRATGRGTVSDLMRQFDLMLSLLRSRRAAFAGCEAEVSDLMRQIDLMVQAKRQESERALAALGAKLDDKDRELIIRESTLEARNSEVRCMRVDARSAQLGVRYTRIDVWSAQFGRFVMRESTLEARSFEVCQNARWCSSFALADLPAKISSKEF